MHSMLYEVVFYDIFSNFFYDLFEGIFMNLSVNIRVMIFSLLLLINFNGTAALCDGATVHKMATFEALNSQECDKLASANIITADNPIPCSRLSRVHFSYLTDGDVIKNDGELIVIDTIAPHVAALTDELLKRGFYMAKARPIELYGGDDNASMKDNNTSAFNGRAVTGGKQWSIHAYGAAIDINPLQNPFIDISEDGTAKISPAASGYYSVNRSEERPGKPARAGMAERVVELFAEHGFFVWGGDWNYPIDYQHFQIGSRSFVEQLAAVDIQKGQQMINEQIAIYMECFKEAESVKNNLNTSRAHCAGKVVEAMP